jgi:hypothetical protein
VETARPSTSRPPYQARPGRRAVVAADLTELHGPTSGVVELPNRLFWQPDRHVDLDKPALLEWMYETVLREAVSIEELRTWLDGPPWSGCSIACSSRAEYVEPGKTATRP